MSTVAYKDDRIGLLKALHIKCASVDYQTRLGAKKSFVECKISQKETAINSLARLEQKANEARNYDIKISEKKFINRLLNNMKHHKYYNSRIASLLTQFELNSDAFNQRWLENKFYALDEERIIHSKLGIRPPATARFVRTRKQKPKPNPRRARCKYCYKPGHIDSNYRDKVNKKPPTMPEWVSKAQCNKCKKNGHLAFNCPPKFNNHKRAAPRSNRYHKFKSNSAKSEKKNTESAPIA